MEELHAHRLQEKQIHRLSDCRNAFILADEMTSLDHADIEFLTGLAEGIHQEISYSSYLTFTNGKVYFLIDSWNTMIPCVLFQSLNKEAARVERSGIEVVNMFIKELKRQIQIVENAGDVRESDNSQEMSVT